MTHSSHSDPRRDRADRIIDALLDGDLAHHDARDAIRRLQDQPHASEELALLRSTVERLRSPIEAPDLSKSILGGMDARRGFLPRRARRIVTVGRVAVAAGLIAAVGVASFLQRHVPQLRLDEGPTPVSLMVRTTGLTADEQPVLVDRAVQTIQASIASPVSRLSLSPRFRPEEQLRFGTDPIKPRPHAVFAAAGGPPFAVGAPEPIDAGAALAQPAASTPTETATGPQLTQSPFIGRFGPLLVILRETPTTIDPERPADDR